MVFFVIFAVVSDHSMQLRFYSLIPLIGTRPAPCKIQDELLQIALPGSANSCAWIEYSN